MTRFTLFKRFKASLYEKRMVLFLAGISAVAVFTTSSAFAQGNLILLQKRVVFEGGLKNATIEFGNIGKDTARYVVSMLNMRMKEDGSFENITEPDSGQYFAEKYVRFFPRNIVLAPNESQTMKIQLVNTRDLQPGEYRSHLYFRAVPNMQDKQEAPAGNKEGISISLKPVFGITIPVIIRAGEPNTTVKLSDLALVQQNDSTQAVNFTIHRSGNFSVYGDITATYIAADGKEIEAGSVKGVAVYTPGTLRTSRLALRNIDGVDYHNGKLVVKYARQAEEDDAVMAEAELKLK